MGIKDDLIWYDIAYIDENGRHIPYEEVIKKYGNPILSSQGLKGDESYSQGVLDGRIQVLSKEQLERHGLTPTDKPKKMYKCLHKR